MIRKLESKHIPDIAKIHKDNLPGFFSMFPLPFIEKFYEMQLKRKNQLLLGAFLEKQLVGFVFGTDDVEKLFENFIKEYRLLFYSNTFRALLYDPKFALLFLGKTFSKKPDSVCKRHLVYIAVDGKVGKKGIGTILLNAFEEEWKAYGYFELEVDSKNKALDFYKKNGFTLVYELNNWVERKYVMGKQLK